MTSNTKASVASTGRIYSRAQLAFSAWCSSRNIVEPTHEDVARYLADCIQLRGISSARVHLSAIGDLFRSQGRHLDSKADAIQAVTAFERIKMPNKISGERLADRAAGAACKVLNKAMIETTPQDRQLLRTVIESQFHEQLKEVR